VEVFHTAFRHEVEVTLLLTASQKKSQILGVSSCRQPRHEHVESTESAAYHSVADVVHDARDESLASGLRGDGTRVLCCEANRLWRESGHEFVPVCRRFRSDQRDGGLRPRSPFRGLVTTSVAALRVCNTSAQSFFLTLSLAIRITQIL
jgi:hypothetical protein